MTISILYFARYREVLNCDKEELSLEKNLNTIDDLLKLLSKRGEEWQTTLSDEKVLVAVNQTISNRNSVISDGDEVAFFPPVTGG